MPDSKYQKGTRTAHFHRGASNFAIKGRWWVFNRGENNETAAITCPDCGQRGLLEDHVIGPFGKVSPSVECPVDGCHFHESAVVLVGWEERDR